MGKGGGGKQSQTSTPYLKQEVKNAANYATGLYKKGQPAYFPDQTYVDYSPETNQALDMISGRATAGSDLTRGASKNLLDTVNGTYLNGNPYIEDIISRSMTDVTDNFSNNVLPGIASNFAQSGRYGSGIQQNLTADAVGQMSREAMGVASGIRYDNYNTERDRQMQAVSQAPTLAANDYFDAQQLMGVGSAREAMEQAKLQDEMDRYWYTANGKNTALDQYISRLSQLNGGFGTKTETGGNKPSAIGTALSLGLTGLGIASGFGAFGGGAGLLTGGGSIPAASTALAGTGARYMLA